MFDWRNVKKALVSVVPFVTALVLHFAGADSDAFFVWMAAVSALTTAGVYVVKNSAPSA